MLSSEHDTQHARHVIDETASLLANHRRNDGDDATNTTASTLISRRAAARQQSYTKTQSIILTTLVVFVIDFAFRLIDALRIEILELSSARVSRWLALRNHPSTPRRVTARAMPTLQSRSDRDAVRIAQGIRVVGWLLVFHS